MRVSRDYIPSAEDPRYLWLPPLEAKAFTSKVVKQTVDSFIASGQSYHSEARSTLQILLDHCHKNNLGYKLTHEPGLGYTLNTVNSPMDKFRSFPGFSVSRHIGNLLEQGDMAFEVYFDPQQGTTLQNKLVEYIPEVNGAILAEQFRI